ncbi:MAG: proteasome subunit beta [Candidatus Nanoarchaeia archaeon]
MKEAKKTGTTTVGIVCRDGIILAADRRSTAGSMIVNKEAKKLTKITDHIAVTRAGVVSDIQLFERLIKAEIKLKEIQTGRPIRVIESANLLASMCYSAIRRPSMIMSIAGFLMGGVDDDGVHLFELEPAGSVTVIKNYMSDGSGMVFALGVLESDFKEGMSLDEGVELAKKAVNAAMQRDTASGNGIDVWAITKKGIEEKFAQAVNIGLY